MTRCWLRGDFLLNSLLPQVPPTRLSTWNLRRLIVYVKTKGQKRCSFPWIRLSFWRHVSLHKIEVADSLSVLYFAMAQEAANALTSFQPQASESDKQESVHLMCFAIFLFMQQINRIDIRMGRGEPDRYPRRSSVGGDASHVHERSRRSSVCLTLGKENIEQKAIDYITSKLTSLLNLAALHDDPFASDYRKPNTNRTIISSTTIQAFDLIFEGCTTSPKEIVPFSVLIAKTIGVGPIMIRDIENFIRKHLSVDPFSLCAPQADLMLNHVNDDHVPFAPSTWHDEDEANGDETSSPAVDISALRSKIVHNSNVAPPTHKVSVVGGISNKTVAKSNKLLSHSVLHIVRCSKSFLYFIMPLRSAVLKRNYHSLIFLGPTERIVRVQYCNNCKIIVCCRRLLISDCRQCTFYIKTPNNPVVFGSGNEQLVFAPYCSSYPDLPRHMEEAQLKDTNDMWNSPIAILNGDRQAKQDEPRCWSLMSPETFFPIYLPFAGCGSNNNIPDGLPIEYADALKQRQVVFGDYRQFIEKCESNQLEEISRLIREEFAAWVEKTGRHEELMQLQQLQTSQEQRRSKI